LRTRDGGPDAGGPANYGETGGEDAESCMSHEGFLSFCRHIEHRS
jgi:hypothetical protein